MCLQDYLKPAYQVISTSTSWKTVKDWVDLIPTFSGEPTDIELNDFIERFEQCINCCNKLGPKMQWIKLDLLRSRLTGKAKKRAQGAKSLEALVHTLRSCLSSVW